MSDSELVAHGAMRMLADAAVDHLDGHNATRACFAARVERG
ncbi:MAG: DUF1203 domain-containing protein [Sphingomonas bacterium]|nr:DUF1203 domain-containing protein [Sphingomonas bacterium]